MAEIPLLELFTQLRKAGLPLGLAEYQLALKSLQAGFGIRDRTALARLCRTLWVKSAEEQALFDYHFDKVMAAEAAAFIAKEKAAEAEQARLAHVENRAEYWRSQLKRYRYGLIAGGLLIAGAIAGLSWRTLRSQQAALACPEFVTTAEPSVRSQEPYLYSPKVRTCAGTTDSDLTFEVMKKPDWLETQQPDDGPLTLSGIAPFIEDGIVNLHSLPDGKTVRLDTQTLNAPVAMSIDGAYIGTLTSTGKVRIWNPQGAKLTEVDAGENIQGIRISPDGQHFLIQSTAQVPIDEASSQASNPTNDTGQSAVRLALWSTASQSPSEPIWTKTFLGYGPLADFNPTGQAIVVADDQQTLSIFNLAGDLKHKQPYVGVPNNVNIRFGPDTEKMATTMLTDSLQLTDQAGNLLHEIDRLPSGARPRFSASGQHFSISSVTDRTDTRGEYGYDALDRGRYPNQRWDEGYRFDRARVNPQQQNRIWHIDNQSNIAELSLPKTLNNLREAGESWEHILSVDDNEVTQLWHLKSKALTPMALSNPSADHRFSPTGQYLWAREKELLDPYSVGRQPSRLADSDTDSDEESLPPSPQLWRLQGQQLIEIPLPANTERIDFLLNDQWLVTTPTTGKQQLWQLNADALVPIAAPDELTSVDSYSWNVRTHKRTTYVLARQNDGSFKLFAQLPDNLLTLVTVPLPPNLLSVGFWESGQYLSATLETGDIRLFRLEGTELIPISYTEKAGGRRGIGLEVVGEYVYIPQQEQIGGLFRIVDDQLVDVEIDNNSRLWLSRNGKYAVENRSSRPRLWSLTGDKATEIELPSTVYRIELRENDQRLITYETEGASNPREADYRHSGFSDLRRNDFDVSSRNTDRYSPALSSRSSEIIQQPTVTRLWAIDSASITELKTWQGSREVQISTSGAYSITMVDNDVVSLLDVDSGILQALGESPPQKKPTLINLGFRGKQVFFDEAQRLVAISPTGQLKKWDFEGKLTQETLLEAPPEAQLHVFDHLSPSVRAATIAQKDVSILNDQGEIVSTLGHDTSVIEMKSSTDGQKLVTGTQTTTLYLWNTDADGMKQLSLDGDISLARLSPDGKTVAAVEDGNRLKLLDTDGKIIHTIEHEQAIDIIAFYPGSDRVLTTTQNTLNIWSIDGQRIRSVDVSSPIRQVVVSPDAQWLVTADESKMSLWDAEGTVLSTTKPNSTEGGRMSFSPQGTLVLNNSFYGARSLWRIVDQQLQQLNPIADENIAISDSGNHFLSWPYWYTTDEEKNRRATLYDAKGEKRLEFDTVPTDNFVHFSADDNHLVLTEREYLVNLKDIETQETITLPHAEKPQEVRLSPNSEHLISSTGNRKKLRVWTLADTAHDNRVVAELENEKDFKQFEFTADDDSIIAIADNSGYLWNVAQQKYTQTFTHKGRITGLAVSQDREYFVTASGADGFAQLRNATGELIAKLPHGSGVLRARFIATSNVLITQSVNGIFRFWDVEGSQADKLIKSFKMPVTLSRGSLSADGKFFIETGFDFVQNWRNGVFEYWDLTGNEPKQKQLSLTSKSLQDEETKPITIDAVALSPYSNHLSTSTGYRYSSRSRGGGPANQVSLWSLEEGSPKLVKTLKNNRTLAWSPDGQSFLTIDAATDKTIRIWNMTGALQHEITLESDWGINSAAFRKDTQTLVVKFEYGESRVIDLQGNEIAKVEKESGLSPYRGKVDDKLVYFSDRDQINVWDMAGKKVNSLTAESRVSDMASTQGSDLLAIALKNGSALLWDFAGNTSTPLKEKHNGSINDIRFSHDGRSLVTASRDTTVRLWNLKGQQTSPPLWNPGSVKAAFFSLDDRSIMALPDRRYSDNSTIHQRPVSGGTVRKINPIDSSFNNFTDIAEESPAAMLEGRRTLHLWNTQGKQLNQLALPSPQEYPMAVSPDAEYVITHSGGFGPNSQRHLRSLNDKREIATWPPTNQVNEMKFSPDSQYVVTVADETLDTVTLKVTDLAGNSDVQSFDITVRQPEAKAVRQPKKVNWLPVAIGSSLGLACLVGGYAVTRQRLLAKRTTTDKNKSDEDSTPETTTLPAETDTSTTPVMPQLEDELQVVKAVQQSAKRLDPHYGDLEGVRDYTPVTRRQMKQSWRYLRKFVRSGPSVEFDVDATVRKIGQDGMLLDPVFVPRRVNRTELLLLIDRDGSMVPFHMLADRLLETAAQGGRLQRTTPYYFHNSPDEYLYKAPDFQDAELLKTVLSRLHRDYGGVLIFSDAGAARRATNPDRLALTQRFIKQLNQQAKYIAWLNPVPRDRWAGSTAEDIAQLIPMFEFNRQGLHQSISVLQGKVLHKV